MAFWVSLGRWGEYCGTHSFTAKYEVVKRSEAKEEGVSLAAIQALAANEDKLNAVKVERMKILNSA